MIGSGPQAEMLMTSPCGPLSTPSRRQSGSRVRLPSRDSTFQTGPTNHALRTRRPRVDGLFIFHVRTLSLLDCPLEPVLGPNEDRTRGRAMTLSCYTAGRPTGGADADRARRFHQFARPDPRGVAGAPRPGAHCHRAVRPLLHLRKGQSRGQAYRRGAAAIAVAAALVASMLRLLGSMIGALPLARPLSAARSARVLRGVPTRASWLSLRAA